MNKIIIKLAKYLKQLVSKYKINFIKVYKNTK